ncbi:MAG: MFS transporter [Deltaproteobacteria bacterium]|nr:MFS transporter [Deltaproteobacteria bacterium]
MAVLFGLGFSSGLPLLLTAATLQAWLTSANATTGEIAAFASVGLAYTFKFAWAPLLDRYALPWLGRRRGWMITLQLGLLVAIAAMGALDPRTDAFVGLAIAVAILSASQDVVLDAYNADLLAPEERAAGAGVYVMGYRVAMLVAGSLALVLADQLPWRAVYAIMAATMVIGVIATLAAEEPVVRHPPRTLGAALVLPFHELFTRLGWRGAVTALAFASLYKFGDQFAQPLLQTFFQRGVGFSMTAIGTLNKAVGFAGTLVGAAVGGALVARHGVGRMLIVFGVLQATTNLLYLWLAADHSYTVFGVAVLVDNVANAMGTGAFVAYLMSLCSPAVSATQFALLTSLSSVGQRVFGPLSSQVQTAVGWSGFFVVTTLLAIPGLVLAGLLRRRTPVAPAPADQSS